MEIMTTTDWLILALVAITTLYAWISFRILRANQAMVSAMKDQQNAAMRPYIQVSVNVRPGTQLLYLSIKNVGKTAAYDLALTLDKDFYPPGKKGEESNLAENTAFSQILDCLPPDGQLLFLLGNGNVLSNRQNSEALSPLQFQVTAEYFADTELISETSSVDLRPHLNMAVLPEPIVEELEKLRQVFMKLSKSLEKNH